MTSKRTKKLRKQAKGGPIATEEEFNKYPELFLFMSDSTADAIQRRAGESSISKETYLKIFKRYKDNIYPEHLKPFARNELRLKHPDIDDKKLEEINEVLKLAEVKND